MPFSRLVPSTQPTKTISDGSVVPFVSYAGFPYGGKYARQVAHVWGDRPGAGGIIADILRPLPVGQRVAVFQNIEGDLFNHPADRLQGKFGSLWWPDAIAKRKQYVKRIVDDMVWRKAGIDFAILDIETMMSYWMLRPDDFVAIYADPRYQALVATGDFPPDCRNMTEAAIMHFNYGCAKLADNAIVEAIVEPFRTAYPRMSYSNFGDSPIDQADAPYVPEFNGHVAFYAPSHASYYSPCLYAGVNILGHNDPRFKEPWYCMALQVNMVRAAYRAKPSAKVMPWVAPKSMSNVLDQDHWQDMIFHVCCLCGPQLLYFNCDDFSAKSNWQFDYAISQYVGQANGQTWNGTLITDLTNYDKDEFVVTAATLADRSILGRVTFKASLQTATFVVDGRSITVERSNDSVGAWFRLKPRG